MHINFCGIYGIYELFDNLKKTHDLKNCWEYKMCVCVCVYHIYKQQLIWILHVHSKSVSLRINYDI